MGRKRRQFSNQFKFTVALEAVKGFKTENQGNRMKGLRGWRE